MSFKLFIEQEEDKDILNTLNKIPSSHSDLIKGYNVKLIPGNTLNGDDEHVGYMDHSPKEIVVASPWNYGREFTFLHEIGHRVFQKLSSQLKQQWEDIVKINIKKQIFKNPKQKESLHQESEEIFCNCYANFYCHHKIVTYNNPEWMLFIKHLPC